MVKVASSANTLQSDLGCDAGGIVVQQRNLLCKIARPLSKASWAYRSAFTRKSYAPSRVKKLLDL